VKKTAFEELLCVCRTYSILLFVLPMTNDDARISYVRGHLENAVVRA